MFTFDGWVTHVAFELHWALETRLHASALNSELRTLKSACGEPRDRNRWNVYCRVPLRLFLLRRAIELLHAFARQSVHPLTAATFSLS